MSLFESLVNYDEEIYPFHMPGHKRNEKYLSLGKEACKIDMTEIIGTDNLHDSHGIIKESQEKCAEVFGAEKSYYLVNGASSGIIASICSLGNNGKIIIQRNSHKSVYNGLIYADAEPIYIYPEIDELGIVNCVNPKEIEKIIKENNDIKACFITSPTYEGFVADIREIANICHKNNIPLIVDEAHGSHFKFSDYFPKTALEMGADIVIQSAHKTLPCFTQSSILHTQGNLFNKDLLEMNLQMIQSSSPSYILMSGLDKTVDMLYKNENVFDDYIEMLVDYRIKGEKYKNFTLLNKDSIGKNNVFDIDLGKLSFGLNKELKNGEEILLKDYKIQIETGDETRLILMTSLADKKEGFIRLDRAMSDLDKRLESSKDIKYRNKIYPKLEKVYNPRDIVYPRDLTYPKDLLYNTFQKKEVFLKDSEGEISCDFLIPYPPGIPLIVPGERINKDTINFLENKYLMEKIKIKK